MSRVTDAIMSSVAFAKTANQPMLDPAFGGQHGWAPQLTEWVSNQAAVRRNLIPILLEYPKFFDSMPDSERWIRTLKALVEVHAKSIDGLQATLTVDTADHPFGGAGEMQDEVVNVTRARSNPSFTWIEKYGYPIQTFFTNWIIYGLMDPETKYAGVGTLADASKRPADMLADWYSMSMLFIEPDPTHRKVVKSWVVSNMFPKSAGDNIGKRDLTSPLETIEMSIEFTGISQHNLGSNMFAQTILDSINITNALPLIRPSFITQTDVGVDVELQGYAVDVDTMSAQALG